MVKKEMIPNLDLDLKDSRNSLQFIHGRALNAAYALSDEYKPTLEEIRDDIRLLFEVNYELHKLCKTTPNKTRIPENIIELGELSLSLIMEYKKLREILGEETELVLNDNMFEIGQEVWHLMGNVAVKCKILALDFCGLYYELDEPTGHAIDESQLARSKKEAISWLKESENKKDSSLQEERQKRVDFIKSTHEKSYESVKDLIHLWSKEEREQYFKFKELADAWGIHSYRNKERLEEWFTISDLKKVS